MIEIRKKQINAFLNCTLRICRFAWRIAASAGAAFVFCHAAQAAPIHSRHDYARETPLRGWQLHWTRIAIAGGVKPSAVFAALGLSHMTRLGYTRDGSHKGVPDPNFPAGLTDVVPYDSDHVFLVCGTSQGVDAFRQQLATTALRLSALRWHMQAALYVGDTLVGVPFERDMAADTPVVAALGGGDSGRMCEISLSQRPPGGVTLTYREAVRLDKSAAIGPVFAPDIAWSSPVTRTVVPAAPYTIRCGTPVVSGADGSGQVAPEEVRITVTNISADATPSAEPTQGADSQTVPTATAPGP